MRKAITRYEAENFIERNIEIFLKNKDLTDISVQYEYCSVELRRDTEKSVKIIGF